MPNYAMTCFFKDAANSLGWSETYYRNAVDLPDMRTEATVLAAARLDILTDEYRFPFYRISDEAVSGDSEITANLVSVGGIASATSPAADPWSCLLVRFGSGLGVRGRKFLHGVPRDMFNASRDYDDGGPNDTAIDAYCTVIKDNDWCIRSRTAIGPPAVYTYFDIDSATPQREAVHQIGRPFGLLRGRR
jgi:hypothetical protein